MATQNSVTLMQALRYLPLEFLLPAWSHGQLTQLRWLHDISGHLNPQGEGLKHREKNSGKPLFRKQYNITRALALEPYKTQSTATSTKLILPHGESACLEAQIEGDVRQTDMIHTRSQSNAKASYVRYTRRHNGDEAISAYTPKKKPPQNGSRTMFLRYRPSAAGASSPQLFRTTNSSGGNESTKPRDQSSISYVPSQPQTVGIVPPSQQEHNMGQSSDIIRGRKNKQTENDYRPRGWVSLPWISDQGRESHKTDQDVSNESPSQPKLFVDRGLERQPETTSILGQESENSDIQLIRTTSDDFNVDKRETDKLALPVRQPGGEPGQRQNTLHSSVKLAQRRSAKPKDEVGASQHLPPRRTRLRDTTYLGGPPAAEEVIHVPVQRELSLLEQLFPEEAKVQLKASEHRRESQEEPARLPPPEIKELYESSIDDSSYMQLSSKLKTRKANINAFRQENKTILFLSRVSTALCDADFRRIIPRGVHIEEWRGPGDILKVIPSRNMSNLSPTSNYYLLFSNPAYARAYQNQVIHLHQLAQTYTPTSLEFPMPPPPGMLETNGQDVYTLLQDFTISPPSVRMSLRVMVPPYHASLQRLLENEGYLQIVQPGNKAGRAVLFWVEGHQPSALSLRTMLSKDGGDRGLQWGPLRGHGEIEVLHVNADYSGGEMGRNDMTDPGDGYSPSESRDTELKPKRHGHQRWIISFEDEAEARRFVRVWHRRPYPVPLQEERPSPGEPEPLVHAEYMW
ncbi:hypothetical protein MMC26_000530 [Xylographa opegraphella]|nr:hypothetical protein [Xylographa opegraphella]